MNGSGQLISIANNLLDKHYNDTVLGVPTKHISSLCAYLPVGAAPVNGPRSFLPWTRYPHKVNLPLIDSSFSIKKRYNRREISQASGVVHIPYNLSIMSAFEHYWQGIPMYLPSERLQREWWHDDSRSTLQEILFPNSGLTFTPDLISLADWYDQTNFRGVRLFDNLEELEAMMVNDDLRAINEEMVSHNLHRRQEILSQWNSILAEI